MNTEQPTGPGPANQPVTAPNIGAELAPPRQGDFCERHWSWLCQAGQGLCQKEHATNEGGKHTFGDGCPDAQVRP